MQLFFCGTATQHGSWPPHSWGFLDHTQRRTTVGRTPLDEWSARRRDLYLTTQTLTTDKRSCPGGIRTHDFSRRAAADLRLRLRGYWDRQDATLHSLFYLETAVHVSGGTSTHHQECKQLYVQHLVFFTPLLLSGAIVEELEPVWACFGWRTPPTAHSNRFRLFHDSAR